MNITRAFFNELRRHCTVEILNLIGSIEPKDDEDNTWDITTVLQSKNNLYEQMRVAYAFEQLGGTLIYNEEPTQFVIIAKLLNEEICNSIRLFWIHNEANGVLPIYDIGAISVPPILPKYAYRPTEDGGFIVEKLQCGEYTPIKAEYYFLEQEAKERTEQLNVEE